MKNMLLKILPNDHSARKWVAVGFTVVVAGLLTFWRIYFIGQYALHY
jgi:hypothetical protein